MWRVVGGEGKGRDELAGVLIFFMRSGDDNKREEGIKQENKELQLEPNTI